MLEKVKEYFEAQYRDTKRAIEGGYRCGTPQEFVNRAIQHCLAVAMFSQTLGVEFEDINPLYEEFKQMLEELA